MGKFLPISPKIISLQIRWAVGLTNSILAKQGYSVFQIGFKRGEIDISGSATLGETST